MASEHVFVELHGGPLDGTHALAPVGHDGRWPVNVVGLPVLVLDERTETFWYDTANYFMLPAANPPKPGRRWWFAYARTLPGWPTPSEQGR
jgi:hypothetical protein